MKNIRSFVNQHTTAVLMLILGGVLLFSFGCGPVDEDDVEQLLQPEETAETTPSVGMDTEPTVEEPVGLDTLTFTIDATDREGWAYFSFATGDVVEVEDAENSDAWDLGFQTTKVKLNGGVSGPGMGSVVMLTETTFDAVTEAPADGYKADTEETFGIVTGSGNGWYTYTGPPTHWILPLEGRVFVIKAADGTFAKVQFVGYYKDNENKKDSGFVAFEYAYQPDSGRNF